MTVNAYAQEPDDWRPGDGQPGDWMDGDCQAAERRASQWRAGEWGAGEWRAGDGQPGDWRDDEEPDDWGEDDDDLRIDFAFDQHEKRLLCITTVGLWRMGLPELFIRPPQDQGPGSASTDTQVDARVDAGLAVFLATALIHLGYGLLAAEGFDVPPYQADLDGRRVRFWLGAQEPPFEQLAVILGPEVDTVIRVESSLWSAAVPRCDSGGPVIN
jgi:hypothetical protein